MTEYIAYFFIDAGTGTTHLLGWNPDRHRWLVPCGNIKKPHRDHNTYAPTAPLCLSCVNLTRHPDPVPRTSTR